MNNQKKITHIHRCKGPVRTTEQRHMSREDRIRTIQKIYDRNGVDVNVEEIYLRIEREYEESTSD